MKNIMSFAGFGKSVRFALAFALLFAVGSFVFYACSNKEVVTKDIKPSSTIRNNKNATLLTELVNNVHFRNSRIAQRNINNLYVNAIDNTPASLRGTLGSRINALGQNATLS